MKSPAGTMKRTINKCTSRQVEEEPPGSTRIEREAEEEPPSRLTILKSPRFFSHVPVEKWKDWKWQFKNRITTIDGLSRYIPLSKKEQKQLKLVTSIYPLSITPYYLSLINADNPDDPIRKQAIPTFGSIVGCSRIPNTKSGGNENSSGTLIMT